MTKRTFRFPHRLTSESFLPDRSRFQITTDTVSALYPLHWHEFYEIELIVSGTGKQILNGVSYSLSPGSLYLLTPADLHEVVPDEGQTIHLYNIKFSDNFLGEGLREALFRCGGALQIAADDCPYEIVEREMSRLLREHAGNLPMKELAVRTTLERLIIDFLRLAAEVSPAPEQPAAGQDLMRALVYIHHHFREQILIEDVAKQSRLSAGYFGEHFREAVGQSFKAYVQQLRLNFSLSLLTGSNIPITDICYASGFNSFPHFLRTFKTKFGQSPTSIRKNAN
ncbi:helix-turn-helix domain-containing protein [Cohnella soli]|uniref:Helix-turn-helix domain-containing protein n=1 Tax=Cohnella soli TaxID=425005 RepID=A0ABW0HU99_9BACL